MTLIKKIIRVSLLSAAIALTGCVVDPGYYGPPAGPYYGAAPGYYPWAVGGVNVDVANGYGHGGYYGGGWGGGGYRGGWGGGGGRWR